MASSPAARVFLALFVAQCLFGIHYQVSKEILHVVPPLVWASLRGLGTAGFFVLVALAMGKLQVAQAKRQIGALAVFALLSTCLNQILFLKGLQYTSAVNSALLNTLIPVVTLLLVTLTGREKLSTRQAAGSLLAFFGVLILMRVEHFQTSGASFFGDVLTLLNVVSYSLFLTFSRPLIKRSDGFWFTTWMFILGSSFMTLAAIPEYGQFRLPEASWSLVGSILYAVFGGTIAAYLLVNYSLSRVPASQVALFVYVQPVVVAMIEWLVFHQAPTVRTLISGALVFAGVALATVPVRSFKRRTAPKTDDVRPGKKAA